MVLTVLNRVNSKKHLNYQDMTAVTVLLPRQYGRTRSSVRSISPEVLSPRAWLRTRTNGAGITAVFSIRSHGPNSQSSWIELFNLLDLNSEGRLDSWNLCWASLRWHADDLDATVCPTDSNKWDTGNWVPFHQTYIQVLSTDAVFQEPVEKKLDSGTFKGLLLDSVWSHFASDL